MQLGDLNPKNAARILSNLLAKNKTHMLHVWYIYLHLVDYEGNRLIHIPYMEHMGSNFKGQWGLNINQRENSEGHYYAIVSGKSASWLCV